MSTEELCRIGLMEFAGKKSVRGSCSAKGLRWTSPSFNGDGDQCSAFR